MNSERFTQLYNNLVAKETSLLMQKNAEYSADNDERLANFIKDAELLNTRPSIVAATLLSKGMHSIFEAVKKGDIQPDWELVNEDGTHREGFVQRISDARNYLFLLLACVEHETETPAMFTHRDINPYRKTTAKHDDAVLLSYTGCCSANQLRVEMGKEEIQRFDPR